MRKPQWLPSHLSALQRTISSNGRPRNTTASRFMYALHCVLTKMKHLPDTDNNGISKSESLKTGLDRRLGNAPAPSQTRKVSIPRKRSQKTLGLPKAVS